MYDLFVKKDALLIEINPYAEDAGETRKFMYMFIERYFSEDVSLICP
jgi:succinyl-CoA synthetase beta subunit